MQYWEALANPEMVTETWECQAALNNRGLLHVWRVGKIRFRSDRRVRVTRQELERTGWKLVHVFASKR